MTEHYDALETRDPAEREHDLFSRLPDVLRKAMAAPAYAEHLEGIDPAAITSRAALARLPVLRKSELPALHKAAPRWRACRCCANPICLPCIESRRRSVDSSPDPRDRSDVCSHPLARSSSPRRRTAIHGAAHERCSPRAFARATSC